MVNGGEGYLERVEGKAPFSSGSSELLNQMEPHPLVLSNLLSSPHFS